MGEFEVKGLKFKVHKISAFKQFHIVRRLAPILGELGPAMKKLQGLKGPDLEKNQFDLIQPVMNGISKLSDEDSNHVLLGLLEAAYMKQDSGNWANMVISGQLAFDNLDLGVLLQVAGRAFAFNLSGFFSEPQPGLPEAG